jgi:hypothetical protein
MQGKQPPTARVRSYVPSNERLWHLPGKTRQFLANCANCPPMKTIPVIYDRNLDFLGMWEKAICEPETAQKVAARSRQLEKDVGAILTTSRCNGGGAHRLHDSSTVRVVIDLGDLARVAERSRPSGGITKVAVWDWDALRRQSYVFPLTVNVLSGPTPRATNAYSIMPWRDWGRGRGKAHGPA